MKDMVISDAQQGLEVVGQNLVDRKLAVVTNDPPTHTMALVNGAQQPLSVTTPEGIGQKPNVEDDQTRKATARAMQVEADAHTVNKVNDIAGEEGQIRNAPTAPNSVQPSGEEIARTAAQVE